MSRIMSEIEMPSLEDQADEQAEELEAIFTINPRFRFIKLVGHGSYGATFHVQLNDPTLPNITDFIVKRAFDEEDAVDNLAQEKRILAVCIFEFVNIIQKLISSLLEITRQ